MKLNGSWIWTKENLAIFNRFVRFRKTFDYTDGIAEIKITGDTRYVLYVNGEYIGYGPVRCWPNHYRYDTYDISPYLNKGKNVIAILVNHYNQGTFQIFNKEPGLLCELTLKDKTIFSDKSFKSMVDKCYESNTQRLSVQQGFEEVYDARYDDGWRNINYDDSTWESAYEIRPAEDGIHNNLEPKNIPNLSMEEISPKRVVKSEIVKSKPYQFNINLKEAIFSNEREANRMVANAYVGTYIYADKTCKCKFTDMSSYADMTIYINGKPAESTYSNSNEFDKNLQVDKLEKNECILQEGWNDFVFKITSASHTYTYAFIIDCDAKLKLRTHKQENDSEFALLGPFELSAKQIQESYDDMDEIQCLANPTNPEVSYKISEEFQKNPLIETFINSNHYNDISEELITHVSPFLQVYTDDVISEKADYKDYEYLVGNNTWTKINPSSDGDVRILLDYGKEVVGYQTLEINSNEGVIVDVMNFEFIQPDGRYNYAEGMCNSYRYVTKNGRQSYQTLLRRGFAYSYITFRNLTEPIYVRNINVKYVSYQQNNQGNFICSDFKLNEIWKVGANTLRACAEDTYTDCPTYEQTLWVGDARNEALIDYMINGDNRLWYRCLEVTGDSLERSKITESQTPSAWQNILPAWTFLWMRSCVEYYKFTGDTEGAKKLIKYLIKNNDGIKYYINNQGLMEIRGWNMFDWAAMDTPPRGTITHINCFAVLALNECADLATQLGYTDYAKDWSSLAASIKESINKYMWNNEMNAYVDCLRGDVQSTIYSQQTHTVAYMAGVAEGDKAKRCKEILYNPPDNFVKAGSPFYEFFLLEALQNENKVKEFIDIIRRDWGFMVEMGATSFWEMWSCGQRGTGERLTRSHCHGWSAAPTFFLSSYILGVKPAKPGFEKVLINPHFGDLDWARGTVPTPYGNVEVTWEKQENGSYKVDVKSNVEYEIVID